MTKVQIVVLNPTREEGKRLAIFFWQLLGKPRQFGTEAVLLAWTEELLPVLKKYTLADTKAALRWALKETPDDFWRGVLFLPKNVVNSVDTIMEQWWVNGQRDAASLLMEPYSGPYVVVETFMLWSDKQRVELRRATDKEYEVKLERGCVEEKWTLPIDPDACQRYMDAQKPHVYKLRNGQAVDDHPCARCGCFYIPVERITDEQEEQRDAIINALKESCPDNAEAQAHMLAAIFFISRYGAAAFEEMVNKAAEDQ
jgi:hypothetical protein